MKEAIEAFIREGCDDEAFDRLAIELFRYQLDRVPLYRAFCESRPEASSRPSDVRSWRDVPAMPADAFKHGLDETGRPHVFESSGTTEGPEQRSRHALTTLDTYRLSAMTQFTRMVMPDEPGAMAVLVLGPTAATHPASSLGCMLSWCAEDHGIDAAAAEKRGAPPPLVAFDATGRVDVEAACTWLEQAAAGSTPVLLLAITSALTAVLDELRRRGRELRLPADSRIVDTGGRKGSARVLSARGVLKACWRFLHVPAYLCINEYGMTEMLSQFYDDALLSRFEGSLEPRAKLGPHWVRTTVVDPATLRPTAAGETGVLRHFDLANWESVACIQTLDLGRQHGRGFELLGRARGADARGCSALMQTVRDARGSA